MNGLLTPGLRYWVPAVSAPAGNHPADQRTGEFHIDARDARYELLIGGWTDPFSGDPAGGWPCGIVSTSPLSDGETALLILKEIESREVARNTESSAQILRRRAQMRLTKEIREILVANPTIVPRAWYGAGSNGPEPSDLRAYLKELKRLTKVS